MQLLKRIFFFISLFALYIIFRELLELYAYAYTFHPYVGYVVLLLILGTLIYFVFIPVYRILTLPVNPGPVSDQSKEAELIRQHYKSTIKPSGFSRKAIANDLYLCKLAANRSRVKFGDGDVYLFMI